MRLLEPGCAGTWGLSALVSRTQGSGVPCSVSGTPEPAPGPSRPVGLSVPFPDVPVRPGSGISGAVGDRGVGGGSLQSRVRGRVGSHPTPRPGPPSWTARTTRLQGVQAQGAGAHRLQGILDSQVPQALGSPRGGGSYICTTHEPFFHDFRCPIPTWECRKPCPLNQTPVSWTRAVPPRTRTSPIQAAQGPWKGGHPGQDKPPVSADISALTGVRPG